MCNCSCNCNCSCSCNWNCSCSCNCNCSCRTKCGDHSINTVANQSPGQNGLARCGESINKPQSAPIHQAINHINILTQLKDQQRTNKEPPAAKLLGRLVKVLSGNQVGRAHPWNGYCNGCSVLLFWSFLWITAVNLIYNLSLNLYIFFYIFFYISIFYSLFHNYNPAGKQSVDHSRLLLIHTCIYYTDPLL